MQTYLHSSRDGRARTRASQRREALKGIRVEVCWRGRLFGTSDMSQWGPALGNPITATGGTEQRVGWEGWGGGVGGLGVLGVGRWKRLLSDCHLGVRTKRFELRPPHKSGSGKV